MSQTELVLASASPRRSMLLERAGFEFRVSVSALKEDWHEDESPVVAASRLATEKALEVLGRLDGARVVLGADTVVVLEDKVLGKPCCEKHACEMLMALSGRSHSVVTAWTLLATALAGGRAVAGFCRSVVRMRDIAWDEAQAYANGGEPMDKAGAYAVQGEGCRLVAAVLGPVDNVIGLPVAQVDRALAGFGIFPSPHRCA